MQWGRGDARCDGPLLFPRPHVRQIRFQFCAHLRLAFRIESECPLHSEYFAELIHKRVWGEAIAAGLSTDDGSYTVGRSDGSVGRSDGTPNSSVG